MNRRKRILLIATFALISCGLGLLLFLSHEPPEPIYNGKPLSYWVQGYDKLLGSKITQSEADHAIRQMGKNAVSRLLRLLETRDSKFKTRAVEMLQRQHWIRFSVKPADDKNFEALGAFKALGPSASNVVPRLVKIFRDDHGPFSQQAVPAILSYIGPPARQAIPALLTGISNTDWIVRYNCTIAMGSIQAEPEMAVPALIKLLDDRVPFVRREAVGALSKFGVAAKAAVPALLRIDAKEPIYSNEDLAAWKTPGIEGPIVLPQGNVFSAVLSTKLQSLQTQMFARQAIQSIDPGALAKAGVK